MTNICGVLLLVLITNAVVWAAGKPQSGMKDPHPDANGVTFQTAGGRMRVEVCGDHVVHVIASSTSEFPTPKVPIVTQPCRADHLKVRTEKTGTTLSTAAVRVLVNPSGALSFLSKDGKSVLVEPM